MSRPRPDVAGLEAELGHRFADRAGLVEALTHASAGAGGNYQRLEFLGDRVLGLAVADLLAEAYPDASEGDLSRRLSELVRRETCADVGADWDLGAYMKLGREAAGTGLRANRSVLADACEAVIGAVFRDAGYPAARALVARAFGARIARQIAPPTNPKQLANEWATGRGLPGPAYAVVERTGSDNAPRFRMAIAIEGQPPAHGVGGSKQAAMQDAARAFLVREGVIPDEPEPSPGEGVP